MKTTVGYKLVRQMADGSLSPLFINKKSRLAIGEWLPAEIFPTKGFAVRPGWHCTTKPVAPHLVRNPKGGRPRVWVEVLLKDFTNTTRPESQGGTWILANEMKILKVLDI